MSNGETNGDTVLGEETNKDVLDTIPQERVEPFMNKMKDLDN